MSEIATNQQPKFEIPELANFHKELCYIEMLRTGS